MYYKSPSTQSFIKFYQTSYMSTCFEHYAVIIVTLLEHTKLNPQLQVHLFYMDRVKSLSSRYVKNQYNMTLDVHECVHLDTIMKETNKMQIYRLIYYS
jgi:hypothetical protein